MQLIWQCLPLISSTTQTWLLVLACSPVYHLGDEEQKYKAFLSESEARLDYMRPCLERKKQTLPVPQNHI